MGWWGITTMGLGVRGRLVMRRWWEDDVELELETTPSAWMPTAAGIRVPARIHIVQRVRGSRAAPMLEVSLRAVWLQAGEEVDPALVRPP